MAGKKAAAEATAPAEPKVDPSAHISWPAEGVRLAGDYKGLAMGGKAKVVLEGTVTGFSMQQYGCSLDLKLKRIDVEKGHGDDDADDTPPMTDAVKKLGGKKGKGGY